MKLISVAQDSFHESGYLCKVGEAVKFTNHDTQTHRISGPFPTFTLTPGQEKVVVLEKAGLHAFASDKFAEKGSFNIQT